MTRYEEPVNGNFMDAAEEILKSIMSKHDVTVLCEEEEDDNEIDDVEIVEHNNKQKTTYEKTCITDFNFRMY